MLADSLIEIAKGIGRIAINPLLYWIILLFWVVGYRRIKNERIQFGTKIFTLFSEGKHTIGLAIMFSLIVSVLSVLFGIVITSEMAVVFIFVIVLLSLSASTQVLSAGYSIGITFLITLLLPFMTIFPVQQAVMEPMYFTGLALLMAIFLIMEACLLLTQRRVPSYPQLIKSRRGVWIGAHHIKRLAFVPFFCLMPSTAIPFDIPLLPYFQMGDQSYMLVLFPFIIGYDYTVFTALPHQAARKIGQSMFLLGLLVLCVAALSVYWPFLSIVTIVCALLGREWLMYTHKKKNKYAPGIFHPVDKGVKVLATIPDSPAARLGIQIGETIIKVNGKWIYNSEQFYEALQNSGAFFKLEILDTVGEVRFINSAMYNTDHHALGVIFVEAPQHTLKYND